MIKKNTSKLQRGSQFESTAHHGGVAIVAGGGGMWSHGGHFQEAERGMLVCPHDFLLSSYLAHEMVWQIIRVSLTSGKLL